MEKLFNGPHQIESDGWYAPQDLLILFHIGESEQARARDAGELKHTMRGNTPLYRGQWVLDWLNASTIMPSEQPTRARAVRSNRPAASAPAQPQGTRSMSTQQTSATAWREAIDAKIKAGMTRQRAVSAVVKEQPALRQAYVDEVNGQRTGADIRRGQPSAAGADVVQRWQQAVQAKLDAGLPRARAVQAVAREQPQLREQFVAAANVGRQRVG